MDLHGMLELAASAAYVLWVLELHVGVRLDGDY